MLKERYLEMIARQNTLPRKVKVASVMPNPCGMGRHLQARLQQVKLAVTAACAEQSDMDLIVFPEECIKADKVENGLNHGIPLVGEVSDTLGKMAKDSHCYLVVPLLLREPEGWVSNAAVLYGREGEVEGVYRKIHPVASIQQKKLEGGIRPGREVPVFKCDFGQLGIQICWDMSYGDGFQQLAAGGAELVVICSASPQTIRPAAYAMFHRYYVLTSTYRDNISIFNPAGMVEAQRTEPGILQHTIDLSYMILHWSEGLDEGRSLFRKFGSKVGGIYSAREDTGVFYSNDPAMSIGEMAKSLGLVSMDEQIEYCRRLKAEGP